MALCYLFRNGLLLLSNVENCFDAVRKVSRVRVDVKHHLHRAHRLVDHKGPTHSAD